MVEQSQVTKAHIQSFLRQARIISDDKINFDRAHIKSLNVMDNYFNMSKSILGKDFNFLQDAQGVRLYLRDVFGPKSLAYFEDSEGEIMLDIEHALLFYYKLRSTGSPLLQTALGLLYFIAGHQVDDEFAQLLKVTTKNKITPSFELNPNLFRWRRCNFVLRKYMLQLTVPQGYKAYYFERPLFNLIGYLVGQGESFDNANKLVNTLTGGLFYTFLPPYIENMLLPTILMGGFDTTLMDGIQTQTFIRDTNKIAKNYPIDDVYNVFNQNVKPNMIELMGMIVNNVDEELAKNPYLTKSDVSIYHLSPQRLGFMLKENIRIEDALPTLHKFFKPVPNLDLQNVVHGEFL